MQIAFVAYVAYNACAMAMNTNAKLRAPNFKTALLEVTACVICFIVSLKFVDERIFAATADWFMVSSTVLAACNEAGHAFLLVANF